MQQHRVFRLRLDHQLREIRRSSIEVAGLDRRRPGTAMESRRRHHADADHRFRVAGHMKEGRREADDVSGPSLDRTGGLRADRAVAVQHHVRALLSIYSESAGFDKNVKIT